MKKEKSAGIFLKKIFTKETLKYAINKVEKACIPPESEKESIHNPSKKLKNKKGNLFSFKG
ncbi:hypothetical protein [uncultured Polaribacter sp.]|uniref:hypothetical protein n=1 Tax=uncultured Polaribacter sp. TaxID=174711 RepID=UPI00261B3E3C|nr:hypothetical protein [uncultured Polaribacter sp.]